MKCIKIVIAFLMFIMVTQGVSASTSDGTTPSGSYAWGENFGWINFGATNGTIHITDTAVTGYAWSPTYGWINLSPGSGGVKNTCTGQLGGNAWSSSLGWISFTGVTINASGKFTGLAGTAGTAAGRINFDCANCNVTTDWRQCALRATPTPTPGSSSSTTTTSTTTTSTTATPTATPNPTPTPTLAPIGFVPPIPPGEVEPTAPSQLFDIALFIDEPLIDSSRKLKARVTFFSFGTEATPIDMEFIVLDTSGKEWYRTSARTTIQTEGVYNQAFADLIIPDGTYTILLKTLYNVDVKDEFKAAFEVRTTCTSFICLTCQYTWWLIPAEIIMITLLLWRVIKQSKEEKHV